MLTSNKNVLGKGCGSVGWAVASDPEVRGSNPVIGKIFNSTFPVNWLYWKDENKVKRGREWPIFKKKNK